MFDLTGKCVFVAGATSGIGRSIAIAASRVGADVFLFGRRVDRLAEVSDEIRAETGGRVLTYPGDATEPDVVARAFGRMFEDFGRVDAAVNSVGTNVPDRVLTELTTASWHRLIQTNLDTAFNLTQAALPFFRTQHDGLIVHIASSGAKTADLSGAGYQASKAGVAALAAATMEEERANGVRVSVIFPGLTDTDFVRHRKVPPTAEDLSRALQPEDVAHACLTILGLPGRAYVPELLVYPSHK